MMNRVQWTVALLLACAAYGVPAETHAQTAESDETPTMQGDLDTFWAEQRGIRVLQRRMYATDNEVQLTLYVGAVPNDPFFNYYPMGLRLGYHLSDSIALEASGSYLVSARTELDGVLRDNGATVYLLDKQIWRANAVALWSPIYGKFSFLGTKLAHFDWYVGAGAGVVGIENEAQQENLATSESGIKPEVIIATGWNLHLSQRFALRLDYRQGIFQAELGGVAYPSELSLGGSVFF